jgi:ABC-type hemin transport system ATPase subunit
MSIQFDSVSQEARGPRELGDVGLKAQSNELPALLDPWGLGKTTLLRSPSPVVSRYESACASPPRGCTI